MIKKFVDNDRSYVHFPSFKLFSYFIIWFQYTLIAKIFHGLCCVLQQTDFEEFIQI